jgi:hypothetical protein
MSKSKLKEWKDILSDRIYMKLYYNYIIIFKFNYLLININLLLSIIVDNYFIL